MDLGKKVKSDFTYKILKFFQENPQSIDTINGIATWTGLSYEKTKETLEELMQQEIVVEHRAATTRGYSYTQNKRIIGAVNEWIAKNAGENSPHSRIY